jgi:hypothetical protein
MYKWSSEDYQRHSSAQESIAESIISGFRFEVMSISLISAAVTEKPIKIG